jgi:hypothetical protein
LSSSILLFPPYIAIGLIFAEARLEECFDETSSDLLLLELKHPILMQYKFLIQINIMPMHVFALAKKIFLFGPQINLHLFNTIKLMAL